MADKTHYRKVFKSDHLGVADLEDLIESKTPLAFTIKHVKQEYDVMVAGRKGNFNIAYFNEQIKPLVLNATNSKTMKKLAGGSAFIEDWKNIRVTLFIDKSAKLKGEVVGGVRISPNAAATISKKQHGILDALIKDNGLDTDEKCVEGMCKYLGIGSLSDLVNLQASLFSKAKTALDAKVKALGEKS
jgi:hypothetical protein